ncbi:peptidyl-tRNA hydrolase [Geoalkalibacter ferrihydriticus]|uniref:Peptidyl-tRNA hydrolase n=2 Tax=Geoalkalibacter ferrihydriticus TaxID=392333 RepID=A0A0C2DSE9_9BACT|nr:aminoacyl-tRNA hydrolase [Geoalkalibacter ferrihydriticus]KIH76384.1 peptidyl-tRNA hydrolase [Geoalkalibacter ferrihydriticus DSM 17813]SDL91791.1 peptidyl-tRNA hydrolase [Geoalkalibacter ferrihydriticus]
MKLIVGLGNPGETYANTRHNVGFMAVRRIADRTGIALKKKGYQGLYGVGRLAGEEVTLLQPHTYMNLSGASVGSACKSLGVSPGDLLVLHDDVDLPFGTLRIKLSGGHGGQKGVRHIKEVLGSEDFLRLRIGVGRPVAGQEVADYVLRAFAREEMEVLDSLLDRAAQAVEAILRDGVQKAMNTYHSREVTA